MSMVTEDDTGGYLKATVAPMRGGNRVLTDQRVFHDGHSHERGSECVPRSSLLLPQICSPQQQEGLQEGKLVCGSTK